MTELQKSLIEIGNSLPGAKVWFRDDWQVYYFDVAGKTFGLLNDQYMTFKGNPVTNDEMRELYPWLIPGYHMNKMHWNSIVLSANEFSETELQALISQSYELVVGKLPKKIQAELKTTRMGNDG
jgi:predicted DNA-binding protein (MmcQ/YjbR family)